MLKPDKRITWKDYESKSEMKCRKVFLIEQVIERREFVKFEVQRSITEKTSNKFEKNKSNFCVSISLYLKGIEWRLLEKIGFVKIPNLLILEKNLF